jgi:hypothetical protein
MGQVGSAEKTLKQETLSCVMPIRSNSRRFEAEPPSMAAATGLEQIGCRTEGPARIKKVMGSSAQPAALARHAGLPLVRGGHTRWLVRAPGRRGALSPEEVAHALKARRAELRRSLDRRRDARGVPVHVREEIVDEAIGLVVMSSKPIRGEQHLQGAFWVSVGLLLAEHRAGRRELHVGTRRRVDFEPLAQVLRDDSEPFDLLLARERAARAADLMAQLEPFERRVFAVMEAHRLGVKRAAKALGEPIETVLAASRGARRKLDQVAAISAAGRMCDYRQQALHAHAQGTARAEQERAARAHLDACAGCRSSYAQLLREMGGREFQRAASAAFLPPPAIVAGVHGGWVERLTTFLSTGRAPTGTATAERTAGLLGGGGMVKAAAAGTALVIAGAGVGAKVIHSLATPAPAHPRSTLSRPAGGGERATVRPTAVAGGLISTVVHPVRRSPTRAGRAVEGHATPRRPPPPSRSLQYLALGRSASEHPSPSRPPVAVVSSTSSSGPAGDTSPRPSRSGGGTSLSYLGH